MFLEVSVAAMPLSNLSTPSLVTATWNADGEGEAIEQLYGGERFGPALTLSAGVGAAAALGFLHQDGCIKVLMQAFDP